MRFLPIFIFAFFLFAVLNAEVYYKETFADGENYKSRWVTSNFKKSSGEQGPWRVTAGDFYGDAKADIGLQTGQDARFYHLTSKMDKVFNNKGKDLVLQFSVKHQQKIDCGGGYIKLLPSGTDQENFNGDSQYNIMFGPDICGSSTRRIHVIFNYKGSNKLIKKDIPCETDQLSHVYTLIVKPDQTYEVRVDGTRKDGGSLLEDWDFLPSKTIQDPSVSKPEDWVDEATIDDPSDSKPSHWDDIPKQIADPEAQKPDDWDDEADGEWEAPMIDNPEYKGEWKPKKIPNPAYKGKWVHPEIANPDYVEDKEIYVSESGVVGFDLWQVKAGTIFDNIIVTDSIAEAESFMAETWGKNHQKESDMFNNIEKEKRDAEEAERKKNEEKNKKQNEQDDEDDEDDKDEL